MSTIKSRPVYPGLSPDSSARTNIIVCDRAGLDAVEEMFARADAAFALRSLVVVANDNAPKSNGHAPHLGEAQTEFHATPAAAIARLKQLLSEASMGVALYAAGSEPLIGSVVQTGEEFGIDHLSIKTEHRGSLKRRVQCVHCKGFTEDVTMNPVRCAGCGLTLLVRDHYSRRFAAFQGVCIDAEVPGEAPEAKPEFQ